MWTFHHEPNGNETNPNGGPGAWRNAMEYIVERWKDRGVTFWQGNLDASVTTQEGIMLCGPNLVAGAYSGNPYSVFDTWWPPNWTWGNQNLVASAMDGYNQGLKPGQTGTGTWRPYGEIVGDPTIGKAFYKDWSDKKRTAQNNAGRPHLQCIFETATRERNNRYTTESAAWNATGLAPTSANWLINMSNFGHHRCQVAGLVRPVCS
jgi:hypothetical protein